MKKRVLLVVSIICFNVAALWSQGVGNQSCAGGGEMWVCGSAQQSKAHSDYDANCADQEFADCTLIRTIVDVCSPDMRESRIIESKGDPAECEVLREPD